MKRFRLTRHLGWIFITAVVIPSVLLVLIAVRAIDREEAYIAKRLEGTLLAEVTHAVSLVNAELKNIQEELLRTAPVIGDDPGESFFTWKQSSSLLTVPFLLSPEHEILWPDVNGALTEDEVFFLKWNSDFITNRVQIPVFQNIAVVYKDEIINKLDAQSDGPIYIQQAISQFEKDESVRKKIYEQAKEKGQKTLSRTVSPSAPGSGQAEPLKQESIFISEELRFIEITAAGEYGFIPRFIDDTLTLLFWKKEKQGRTVGCVINDRLLRERIVGVLPNIYSSARILTLLDEHGRPLVTPEEEKQRDWQKPFAAREISENLPRWEVTAYLTDPNIISSRAHLITTVMWVLILILFVSILSGGVLVLKTLHIEMALARQKTTFVANVSHELKTPLTSIRMFAEMLKERRQPDEEKQQNYLNIMVSETERLTRLINNVLDFSQMDRGGKRYTFKSLDIARLCENLVEGQRIRYEHNGFKMHFTTIDYPKYGSAQLIVKADEEAIKQAVLNLLSNAEKYSEEAKIIEVEVTCSGSFVHIDIKDRGVGIQPQHAKKIFKEFYRIDDRLTSKAKGTGLGLTIARRIIQDHGGDLLYLPREGGGSIFQIRLPVVME